MSDAPVPYEPISLDRLNVMIAGCKARAVSDEMFDEIADALDCFFMVLVLGQTDHKPGPKHSAVMHFRAYRVHVLMEQHGAYLQSAISAVLGDSYTRLRAGALEKAYRALKPTGFPEYREVSADILARDAARLPQTRRNK